MKNEATPPLGANAKPSLLNAHWKARFFVAAAMLLMALIGLILIDVSPQWAWSYWRIMIVLYTLLSLWLSWHLRQKGLRFESITLWHELAHWIALIFAVSLVTVLVDVGILSRMQAGLMVLILLALTLFLAGIYIDRCFVFIGIAIGAFVIVSDLLEAYLSVVMVPILILAFIILAWWLHRDHAPNNAGIP